MPYCWNSYSFQFVFRVGHDWPRSRHSLKIRLASYMRRVVAPRRACPALRGLNKLIKQLNNGAADIKAVTAQQGACTDRPNSTANVRRVATAEIYHFKSRRANLGQSEDDHSTWARPHVGNVPRNLQSLSIRSASAGTGPVLALRMSSGRRRKISPKNDTKLCRDC